MNKNMGETVIGIFLMIIGLFCLIQTGALRDSIAFLGEFKNINEVNKGEGLLGKYVQGNVDETLGRYMCDVIDSENSISYYLIPFGRNKDMYIGLQVNGIYDPSYDILDIHHINKRLNLSDYSMNIRGRIKKCSNEEEKRMKEYIKGILGKNDYDDIYIPYYIASRDFEECGINTMLGIFWFCVGIIIVRKGIQEYRLRKKEQVIQDIIANEIEKNSMVVSVPENRIDSPSSPKANIHINIFEDDK